MRAIQDKAVSRFWIRHLRNAAALARLQVLACLKTPGSRDAIGRGAGGDLMKQFDFIAEQTMVKYLARRSSFALISEEAGNQQIGSHPDGYIIMDPIDGSTNVSQGISFACIAVAFARKANFESIEAAVVQDLFSRNSYYAVKGEGVWKNQYPIRRSNKSPLESHLLGVDDRFPSIYCASETSKANHYSFQLIRHLGANALELCFVADGSIDGFVDLRGVFRGTDLAAAALILREAGASLIDENGHTLSGACTNEARYSLIAARDAELAKKLLNLAR